MRIPLISPSHTIYLDNFLTDETGIFVTHLLVSLFECFYFSF